jgi:hypothetical protein
MATIWKVDTIAELRPLFEDAGSVDEEGVAAHLAGLREDQRPAAPFEPTLPRWFYLLTRDRRVVLRTVGMSLEQWDGPAKVIIGTFVHIGEFARTRMLRGRKGLRITLEPIEMLQGPPARFFTNGQAVLAAIDWQVLDERPERKPSRGKRGGGR